MKGGGQRAVEVDEHRAAQTQRAADELPGRQGVGFAEHQSGEQHRHEGGGGIEDRAAHTGGVSQTDIKEEVLDAGLQCAQQQDARPLTLLRQGRPAAQEQSEDQSRHAGQREAQPGEHHLPGHVAGGDAQQGVTQLDGGIGAAPQEGAQHRQQNDDLLAAEKVGGRHGKVPLYIIL